jgi:hypothetical protein
MKGALMGEMTLSDASSDDDWDTYDMSRISAVPLFSFPCFVILTLFVLCFFKKKHTSDPDFVNTDSIEHNVTAQGKDIALTTAGNVKAKQGAPPPISRRGGGGPPPKRGPIFPKQGAQAKAPAPARAVPKPVVKAPAPKPKAKQWGGPPQPKPKMGGPKPAMKAPQPKPKLGGPKPVMKPPQPKPKLAGPKPVMKPPQPKPKLAGPKPVVKLAGPKPVPKLAGPPKPPMPKLAGPKVRERIYISWRGETGAGVCRSCSLALLTVFFVCLFV